MENPLITKEIITLIIQCLKTFHQTLALYSNVDCTYKLLEANRLDANLSLDDFLETSAYLDANYDVVFSDIYKCIMTIHCNFKTLIDNIYANTSSDVHTILKPHIETFQCYRFNVITSILEKRNLYTWSRMKKNLPKRLYKWQAILNSVNEELTVLSSLIKLQNTNTLTCPSL